MTAASAVCQQGCATCAPVLWSSDCPTTRVVQPGCNAAWLCFCSQAANFLQPGSAFCSLGPNLQPGSARASQAAKIRARLQAAERQAAPGCKPGCSLAALGCSLAEKPRARLQIRKLQPGSAQAANMEPGCSPNAAPEAWAAAWLARAAAWQLYSCACSAVAERGPFKGVCAFLVLLANY